MKTVLFLVASVVGAGVASAAPMPSTLYVYLNSFDLTAYNSNGGETSIGSNFSGQLGFSTGNAWVRDVVTVISGSSSDNDFDGASVQSLSGSLQVQQNVVTGGWLSLALELGGVSDGSYNCTITPGSGGLASGVATAETQPPGGNQVFGSNMFAGVDVSPWMTAPPVTGSIRVDSNPNDTEIDLAFETPEPASLSLMVLAGAGLLARRIRRS